MSHGAFCCCADRSWQVERIPCLSDNYSWLLVEESGKVAIVDPAEFGPVDKVLQERRDTIRGPSLFCGNAFPSPEGFPADACDVTVCRIPSCVAQH